MKDLLFLFPVVFAISLVLGGCRAERIGPIFRESGKTFGKILGAIVVIVVVLQIVLWFIPRIV